jgi:hypothetical protein
MARGDRVNFRFHIAKSGFFKRLPVIEHNCPMDAHSDYVAEVKLMRAVLDQAIHDLGSAIKAVREEAEAWVDLKNEDFLVVCELADLDTKATYWTIKKTLDTLTKSRNPMKEILSQFSVDNEDQLVVKIMNKGVKDAKCYSPST